MRTNIISIKENEYYILYKRIKDRTDCIPLYVIYYSNTYGGGISKEFSLKQQAIRFFNMATKEALEYEKELI